MITKTTAQKLAALMFARGQMNANELRQALKQAETLGTREPQQVKEAA
jgi:hypothetical protein